MDIEKQLNQAVATAVKDLYGVTPAPAAIQIQTTKREFEGNYTLVTFPFLKFSHKRPEDTGEDIGAWLTSHCEIVAAYNVVKGFLNVTIAEAAWTALLSAIDADDRYGERCPAADAPLVMIEYSSPNTNKPLHLGHIRNILLGWSLAQIMRANGYNVVKTSIVNDRGIHICKSMLAWKKWGEGITPQQAGKKGDHLVGDYYVLFDKKYREEVSARAAALRAEGVSGEAAEAQAKADSALMSEARAMLVAWERCDPDVRRLWNTMNGWVNEGFDATYRALGVTFDKVYYESDTYVIGKAKVEEGLADGTFFRKDNGSVWVDLTADGLDEKLLLRSDGTSVYMTQDIGTAAMRFNDYPIDRMIYVVGNEQNYHFQVLSLVLQKLGYKWGKDIVHFSYGMVELPDGKMKSREGTVVDADELMDEMTRVARQASEGRGMYAEMSEEERDATARIVGLGALKYFILKVDARKNMLFNPSESIDLNGNTGPFIQYTHARICSILRKAAAEGIDVGRKLPADTPVNDTERELIQRLSEYAAVVTQAAKDYSPSVIANYCYELTKEFNRFYHDYSILSAESDAKKALRLMLARNVGKIIHNGMSLLGIEVPERM